MKFFITGTDTNIGKTLVSSWLCLHTGFDYFKPIQTGSCEGTDSQLVSSLTHSVIHKEVYVYKEPASPYLAAKLENQTINLNKIVLPKAQKLIVEGAGGLMVPLNEDSLMIDLIKRLSLPVILVASSRLGTLNHILLSLEALKLRNIETLGVIVSGNPNQDIPHALRFYGATPLLAQIPFLPKITQDTLRAIPLPDGLRNLDSKIRIERPECTKGYMRTRESAIFENQISKDEGYLSEDLKHIIRM